MATRKTTPLDGSLIARKGEAVPAVMGTPRQKPISVTVKLERSLYLRLKALGVETDAHQTNQAMIVKAIEAYVEARERRGTA